MAAESNPESSPVSVGDGSPAGYRVVDQPESSRYCLLDGDRVVGVADYHQEGTTLVVPHVEVDRSRRGQGLGDVLMEGVLAHIRNTGRAISPVCPFAAKYMAEHPDQQDLLA